MSGFNTRFKRMMKRRGIGATKLSRMLGVSRNNIYRYMHVVNKPTPMTIWKIANALDCKPSQLDPDWEEDKK